MTYTRTIYEACRNQKENFTPLDIYELLLSRGVAIKKGTVKRIINRLYHREILSRVYGQRGLYFFASEGDSYNHLRGQKGTNGGCCNHLKQSKDNTASPSKRGQKNDFNAYNHFKRGYVLRRTCSIFANSPDKIFTIKEIYRIFKDSPYNKIPKYRTVQSAVYYLLRRGIIYRVSGEWGQYALTNREIAIAWLEGGGIPQAPREGTTPRFKLPSLNLHGQRVDKVIIIPETVWGRLKSMQSSLSPYFNKKPPNKNDPGRQWVFETDNVKWVISEKTLRTQIFPKGEDWLKDLSEYLGAWVVEELKGTKVVMHGAINKREYESYRAGVLEVVEDYSEWPQDGDIEFHGDEEAVKTAMGLTLTGRFTPEQSATIASLIHTYNKKHREELEKLIDELTIFSHYTVNNLNYLAEKLKKHDEKFETINNQIEELKKEVKDHLNTIAGGIRLILNKPQMEIKGEVEGYV